MSSIDNVLDLSHYLRTKGYDYVANLEGRVIYSHPDKGFIVLTSDDQVTSYVKSISTNIGLVKNLIKN